MRTKRNQPQPLTKTDVHAECEAWWKERRARRKAKRIVLLSDALVFCLLMVAVLILLLSFGWSICEGAGLPPPPSAICMWYLFVGTSFVVILGAFIASVVGLIYALIWFFEQVEAAKKRLSES